MKKCLLLLAMGSMVCWAPVEDSPLIAAVRKRDEVAVAEAIRDGADVNERVGANFPNGGCPVLHYAIACELREIVHKLIEAGADVNAFTEGKFCHIRGKDARNIPLLSYAINSERPIGITEELINAGADVNKRDLHGNWTPSMIAAYVGYVDAFNKLLAAGADQSLKNPWDGKRKAIDYAYEQGHDDIIELWRKAKPRKSCWSCLAGR